MSRPTRLLESPVSQVDPLIDLFYPRNYHRWLRLYLMSKHVFLIISALESPKMAFSPTLHFQKFTNSLFLTKENFVRPKLPINPYYETSRHIQENNLECILSIETHLSPPVFFVARVPALLLPLTERPYVPATNIEIFDLNVYTWLQICFRT